MDTPLFRLDEVHLRLLGRGLLVLGLPLIAAMWFLGPVKPAKGMLPRGFTMPMLAIELPKSGEAVATIVRVSGKGETAEEQAANGAHRMKNGLLLDLGIILLYGSTLAALGLLLYQSPAPGFARIAGAVAAVLGVTAGLLDVVENVRIWKVIGDSRDAASVDALFTVSLWKWGLLAVAFLLLSGLFALGTRTAAGLAVLCLVTGVLGTIGLKQNLLLEKTMMVMVLTLLAAILLFAFRPGNLLRGPRIGN
jgi:hypothetical protein